MFSAPGSIEFDRVEGVVEQVAKKCNLCEDVHRPAARNEPAAESHKPGRHLREHGSVHRVPAAGAVGVEPRRLARPPPRHAPPAAQTSAAVHSPYRQHTARRFQPPPGLPARATPSGPDSTRNRRDGVPLERLFREVKHDSAVRRKAHHAAEHRDRVPALPAQFRRPLRRCRRRWRRRQRPQFVLRTPLPLATIPDAALRTRPSDVPPEHCDPSRCKQSLLRRESGSGGRVRTRSSCRTGCLSYTKTALRLADLNALLAERVFEFRLVGLRRVDQRRDAAVLEARRRLVNAVESRQLRRPPGNTPCSRASRRGYDLLELVAGDRLGAASRRTCGASPTEPCR